MLLILLKSIPLIGLLQLQGSVIKYRALDYCRVLASDAQPRENQLQDPSNVDQDDHNLEWKNPPANPFANNNEPFEKGDTSENNLESTGYVKCGTVFVSSVVCYTNNIMDSMISRWSLAWNLSDFCLRRYENGVK